MNELIPIIGILAGCGSMAFVVWTVADYIRRRHQAQTAADFHARLLDKLGSTKDFADFLGSEGGSRFLDSLALQREGTPQDRILRSISTGIMLTVVGFGLALYTGEIRDYDFGMGVGLLAALALSSGIGLLLAAFATEKTARRFGLIEDKRADTGKPTAI